MSATGRNLEGHERHPDDFYETPGWCTQAILRKFNIEIVLAESILDAGSGTGAIAREVYKLNPEVSAIENNLDRHLQAQDSCTYKYNKPLYLHQDFLEHKRIYDIIISNPPYGQAQEFAEHAIKHSKLVIFLLRLNWLASKRRKSFHQKYPADLYVLSKRPSFTNKGTDATEYAWFCFGEGLGNRWHLLDVESHDTAIIDLDKV